MVVSLPSSLTGVVRKKEVSDYFHARAAAGRGKKHHGGGRGRYFNEEAAGDSSLTELFQEGQVGTKGWVGCAQLSNALSL